MNADVSEIKSRLNIVDVLGEYIKLDKAGANWRALCPFHNEKSPSFMVNEEKQMWHCFGCQKSGDIFGFVMEMEGLEFREALKNLADKAGVKLQNFNPQKTEEKNRTIEILELATKFYEVQLWKGAGREKIIKYLKERGLTEETIKEFRLGYAPDGWRNVLNFLTKRGYSLAEILKTGLLVEKNTNQNASHYDRFRDRIMFPISDYSGKVLGYSARVAPGGDESQAKYVNTPETEVYHKSQVLYGLDKAKTEIKKKDAIILVEGNMDVIAMHQAGMKNVSAVSGTALTQEQVEIIKRYTRNIKMFFDMDSAGEAATKKSIKLCLSKEMAVSIINISEGKDAADLAKDNPEELRKSVKEALQVMEYFFQKTFAKFNKKEVEGKKKITNELLEIISILENDVEKNHWLRKLAEELDISELALTDMLKKASLKDRIERNDNYSRNRNTVTENTLVKNESKQEILEKELIGIMFISPDVWKEALKEAKRGALRLKDGLLNQMLSLGEKTNFDFDIFIKEISDDREMLSRAEKIFFKKKYQLDLNNNLEEIILKDPLEDFNVCLRELRNEIRKKDFSRITADLKLAEKRNDRDAIIFLRQEFDKISKDLFV